MSLRIVAKQLKREAAANKGKAGVLAAVCFVALYFWAPLVTGWISGGKSKPSSARTANASLVLQPSVVPVNTIDIAAATKPADEQEQNATSWRNIVKRIEQDGRMRSAGLPDLLTNPFGSPPSADSKADADDDSSTTDDAKLPPKKLGIETLGIALTSTMVGNGRAVVQVNGKTITIPVDHQGLPRQATALNYTKGTQSYAFRVVAVRAGELQLELNDYEYVLEVRKPRLATNDEVSFYMAN